MSLPDQTPKLPKLPFIAAWAALLLLGWFLVYQAQRPLAAPIIIGAIVCVGLAGFLVIIPFLSDYARRQDEALDERQRGLEALSRTVTSSAEQISIAANGLHEIADLAHKNLKHAEQLPQKLHEQIAAFTAQLDNAREDDREELEKEIVELRASETERLEGIAEKVQKAVADLTKLDAAVQKHLTARSEFLQKTADAIAKSHTDATVALNEATSAATRELTAAQTKAAAEIDTKLADRLAAAQTALDAAVKAAQDAAAQATAAAERTATLLANLPATPPAAPAPLAVSAPVETTEAPPAGAPEVAAPPKRARKTRREEPPVPAEVPVAPTEPTADTPPPPAEPIAPAVSEPAPAVVAAPPEPEPIVTVPEAPAAEPASAPEPVAEPPPIPLASIPAIEPVAPSSAHPFPSAPAASEPEPVVTSEPTPVEAPAPGPAEAPVAAPETPVAEAAPAPAPEPVAERPARKRARKPEPDTDLLLDLGHDELGRSTSDDSQEFPADASEHVISSDGATRLIATAYIGIGNRLFIRGDGPGLSWEKGVPLQFVSIGKWRWETADATVPIAFKLYKNDEIECAPLGRLTLEPGHQQEVTAKF